MENLEEKTNVFIEPNADVIFIERDPVVKETKTGIAIPETAREKPNLGTIRLVGPDCKKAIPGQRIMFGKGSGMDIYIGDLVFTMLREKEIYAFHNIPPAEVGEGYKVGKFANNIMKK